MMLRTLLPLTAAAALMAATAQAQMAPRPTAPTDVPDGLEIPERKPGPQARNAEPANAPPRALDYPTTADTPSRDSPDDVGVIGDRPTLGGDGEYPGGYRLVSVNGRDLPVQIGTWQEDGQTCVEHVLSGGLKLAQDNTYTARMLTRQKCGGRQVDRQTETERGTWKRTGNAVYLNEDRIEGAGSGEQQKQEWQGAIPIENLGGTGELQGQTLTIGLEDGRSRATFQATNAPPGQG